MSGGASWEEQEARGDRRDPIEEGQGRQGDHPVVEAQTKLAGSLGIGPRSQEHAEALWSDFAQRPDHGLPERITTDEYRVSAGALLRPDGLPTVFPRPGQRGRPRQPRLVPPRDVVYAMGHTLRRKGRVVPGTIRRVFGTAWRLAQALARSTVSAHGNTSVVERCNATIRQHNSR